MFRSNRRVLSLEAVENSVSSFSASRCADLLRAPAWIATLFGPMGSTSKPFAAILRDFFFNVTICRGELITSGMSMRWGPFSGAACFQVLLEKARARAPRAGLRSTILRRSPRR